MKECIFPETSIHQGEVKGLGLVHAFHTKIRKKHRGKHYLAIINTQFNFSKEDDFQKHLTVFLKQCYLFILVGKINPRLETFNEAKIYEEHIMLNGEGKQVSETDRIVNLEIR